MYNNILSIRVLDYKRTGDWNRTLEIGPQRVGVARRFVDRHHDIGQTQYQP